MIAMTGAPVAAAAEPAERAMLTTDARAARIPSVWTLTLALATAKLCPIKRGPLEERSRTFGDARGIW